VFDIKANTADGPLAISPADRLSITIGLATGGSTTEVDWWLAIDTPFGWYRYQAAGFWQPGLAVSHQGPLFGITDHLQVLDMADLPIGAFTFYFGVDQDMNGQVDEPLFYDTVAVDVADQGRRER